MNKASAFHEALVKHLPGVDRFASEDLKQENVICMGDIACG